MKITAAAWNIQEGLAIPERSAQLVEGIKQLDADVVTLSDAYWPGNPLHTLDMALVDEAKAAFDAEGYATYELLYDDAQDPYPSRYMLGLSRVVSCLASVNLDGRNALKVSVYSEGKPAQKELHVYGVHLDDRHESRRVSQAYGLLSELDENVAQAVIGDFNCLDKNTYIARVIGATLGRLDHADHISRRVPDRVRAVASKLGDMASGISLEVLHGGGLRDVSGSQATFPARLPALALDKCLVSADVCADIAVQPHRAGSDHRALKASLEI